MNKRLYLIDGSGYIFRAFYAVAPLTNSKGQPTNALVGFTRMLLKLLKDKKPEHVVVAFDLAEETFRKKLYPEYKANRIACPPELALQMPFFRKITIAYGLHTLEKSGFEADDIIASLCKKFVDSFEEIVIVSGDKDLAQLVTDKVTVWDPMRDITYDPARVFEKFCVHPHQIRDYLTITGDSSDNIPGVPGVGEKSAVKLLSVFGSIENLVQNIENIKDIEGLRGAKSIGEKIKNNLELLNISKELVTLYEDVYEEFDERALLKEEQNPNLLGELYQELEIREFKTSGISIAVNDLKKNFYTILNKELPYFAEKLAKVKEFALDTECDSLDTLKAKLMGISISWEEASGYYIPVAVGEDTATPESVNKNIGLILKNESIPKYGFNLKFDYQVLLGAGLELKGIAGDAMLAMHLIDPDKKVEGLKANSKKFLNEDMLTYEELTDGKPLREVPLDKVSYYACHDAECSYRLYKLLEGQLVPFQKILNELEYPLIEVLSRMEKYGIKINVNFLKELEQRYSIELENMTRSIVEHAGIEFNLNSPKQLGEILFEKLKIPTKGIKKTTHGFSTDAKILENLIDYPIVKQILEYREIQKLLTTYIRPLQLTADDGRIHTNYNQTIAATGRLSSTAPNLQNIPIKNQSGRELRKAFVADEGYMLVSADYSQIELRVLAELSGDENLREVFRSSGDIHTKTAERLFKNNFLMDDKEKRRVAKTINFGILYGMSAFRLSRELSISKSDADRFVYDYFQEYPGIKNLFDRYEKMANVEGYVETLYGRRRYLNSIEGGRDEGYAQRSLNNLAIQGTAAEIVKKAMIDIHRELDPSAKLLLQVHDEVVLEVPIEKEKTVCAQLKSIMENTVKLSVPLEVDVKVGPNWGEMKSL